MDGEGGLIIRRRAFAAIAVAIIAWIYYVIIQLWTPMAILGYFLDCIYILFIYLFMPLAFSALLLVIIQYLVNRARGYYDRDIVIVILLTVAVALAFYVTVFVIGAIAIVKATTAFLVFRLIWQLK